MAPRPLPSAKEPGDSPEGDSGEPLSPFPDRQALPPHWGNAQAPHASILGWSGETPAASFLPSCQWRGLSPLPALLGLALPRFCFGRTSLYLQASPVQRGSPPWRSQQGVGRRPSSTPSTVQPCWDASVWASPEHIPFLYLFLVHHYLVL